jgi:hypothetical protein
MANGTATLPEREVRERRPLEEEEHIRRREEVALGGSATSGLIAAAGAILAIIGLAGIYSGFLLAVSSIVLGVSFLFEGGAIVARRSALLQETTEGRVQLAELGAGMTGETLAGLVGIVLGILSLVGVVPAVLLPCAVIVFGAALILGSGANVRMNDLAMAYRQEHPAARRVMREAVIATTGLQVLVGLGAITLGIIALARIMPLVLSLVGVLVIGITFLLSNAVIAGRMMNILRR